MLWYLRIVLANSVLQLLSCMSNVLSLTVLARNAVFSNFWWVCVWCFSVQKTFSYWSWGLSIIWMIDGLSIWPSLNDRFFVKGIGIPVLSSVVCFLMTVFFWRHIPVLMVEGQLWSSFNSFITLFFVWVMLISMRCLLLFLWFVYSGV